ncbi:Cyanophycinase [Fulvia fulva]|nr:Cyanophycinase [Fulvia fulva]KAK4614840.1 Cyanophycinase [Fulvia fulva]WPV20345.1 Cyanophycinase [Fulvia fulva]WPV35292.1 Cyanophycinase [Fulvia fulva]
MLLTSLLCAAFTATSLAYPRSSTNGTNTTYIGPENGHLVSESIYEKIIELAGGPDAPIVVIPTAGGEETYSNNFTTAVAFRRWGATNVTVLHTYDQAIADTDEFVAPLKDARGVFFGGGTQWRLVDVYVGTKAETAFQSVLDSGGVIGGSSAGASIQGSFLARGDTANNQVMIGDHTVGFGYLKNTAIDQHVLVRNRQFDMSQILEAYPELLGAGCDEDTALVINKNHADIIGSMYCLIYDGKFWLEEGTDLKQIPSPAQRFFFLKPGDAYDLGERRVLSNRTSTG